MVVLILPHFCVVSLVLIIPPEYARNICYLTLNIHQPVYLTIAMTKDRSYLFTLHMLVLFTISMSMLLCLLPNLLLHCFI